MSWRFFDRIPVLPWVTLNLSKRGASVSVGPQGAKVTVGTSGAQVTAGLPGSGLFYTERFSPADIAQALLADPTRATWRKTFIDHLGSCLENRGVTLAELTAALDYRDTLRLTDEELGPTMLQGIATLRSLIAEMKAAGRTKYYETVQDT